MPFFTFSHEFFPYWISVLLLSIIFPLAIVLKFLEVKGEHSETLTGFEKFRMNLSAILVLVGGFIIRMALIYAGQLIKMTDKIAKF